MADHAQDAVSNPIRFFKQLRDYSRDGYLGFLVGEGFLRGEKDFIRNAKYVLAVHRHWHSKSLQGCHFAESLAGRIRVESALGPPEDGTDQFEEPYGWDPIVVPAPESGLVRGAVLDEIEQRTEEAIKDHYVNAISLIFPSITTFEGVVNLLKSLEKLDAYSVEENTRDTLPATRKTPHLVSLGLRINLGTYKREDVQSYALGFGPLTYIGKTRLSPLTEIVFLTNPKRLPPVFYKLSPDPHIAHLADHHFPLDEEKPFEKLWRATEERKIEILQGKRRKKDERDGNPTYPPHIEYSTKARCTFAVPKELW